MILYEVTLEVEPSSSAAVEEHMRRRHIPAIFATGCFRRIRFQRTSGHRYRTTYEAEEEADLERYLLDHAPAMRAEFLAEFPTEVRLSRETWREVESWG
jgi:Domain of unknown function (DUF4286)